MRFKYEQQAYQNAALPESFAPPDVFAFLALRTLYQQYKTGTITKEQAEREKNDIEQKHRYLQFKDELYAQGIRLFGNISRAAAQLEKAINGDGNLVEAAKALHFAIYDIVPEWKSEKLKEDLGEVEVHADNKTTEQP